RAAMRSGRDGWLSNGSALPSASSFSSGLSTCDLIVGDATNRLKPEPSGGEYPAETTGITSICKYAFHASAPRCICFKPLMSAAPPPSLAAIWSAAYCCAREIASVILRNISPYQRKRTTSHELRRPSSRSVLPIAERVL